MPPPLSALHPQSPKTEHLSLSCGCGWGGAGRAGEGAGVGVPEAQSAAAPFWLDLPAFHTFLGFKEEKGLLSPLSLQMHRLSMTSTVGAGSAVWPAAGVPVTAPIPPPGGAHALTHTFLGWALLARTTTTVSSVSDSWYGSCPQGSGGGGGGGVLLFEPFLKLGK